MKKIFTLAIGLIITAAVFAADRRPDVTITSMRQYEVVIDGRSYMTNSRSIDLNNLRNGYHSIQVYDASRGFSMFRRKTMISNSSFELRNRDVNIMIDRFGHLNISEDRFGGNDFGRDQNYGRDQKGWDGRDQNGWGKDSHDNGYDNHGNRRF